VDEVNLRAMQVLRERFEVPVGFSDHTLGFEVALAAVALGASVLEKHLTLDKRAIGPDHAASLEPAEFAEMVRCIRVVESALGNGEKVVMPSERDTATVARKSLVSARDIPAGTVLSEEDISIRRPGTGLAPYRYQETVGRRARSAIEADSVLTEELLE
jgi:sialic acid synthase SpsE